MEDVHVVDVRVLQEEDNQQLRRSDDEDDVALDDGGDDAVVAEEEHEEGNYRAVVQRRCGEALPDWLREEVNFGTIVEYWAENTPHDLESAEVLSPRQPFARILDLFQLQRPAEQYLRLEKDVANAVVAGDEEDTETLLLLGPEGSREFALQWFLLESLPMKTLKVMLLRGRVLLQRQNDA